MSVRVPDVLYHATPRIDAVPPNARAQSLIVQATHEAVTFLHFIIGDGSRNTVHRVEAARVLVDAYLRDTGGLLWDLDALEADGGGADSVRGRAGVGEPAPVGM